MDIPDFGGYNLALPDTSYNPQAWGMGGDYASNSIPSMSQGGYGSLDPGMGFLQQMGKANMVSGIGRSMGQLFGGGGAGEGQISQMNSLLNQSLGRAQQTAQQGGQTSQPSQKQIQDASRAAAQNGQNPMYQGLGGLIPGFQASY
jgi:hypothetical protein